MKRLAIALAAAAAVMTAGPANAATPGQEYAACHAAYELHQHQLEHAYVPSRAWWDTWKAAKKADHELEGYIHSWMLTGKRWYRVADACNPDAPIGQP